MLKWSDLRIRIKINYLAWLGGKLNVLSTVKKNFSKATSLDFSTRYLFYI